MKLYTKDGCPRCKVLKAKLAAAHISYEENSNITELIAMGLKSAPVLELDSGQRLDFTEALRYIKEIDTE